MALASERNTYLAPHLSEKYMATFLAALCTLAYNRTPLHRHMGPTFHRPQASETGNRQYAVLPPSLPCTQGTRGEGDESEGA